MRETFNKFTESTMAIFDPILWGSWNAKRVSKAVKCRDGVNSGPVRKRQDVGDDG